MQTYMIHVTYTQMGIENIKGSPYRVEAAKQIISSMGGEASVFYAVMGAAHDAVFILEAPGDDAAAKIALNIAMHGNVRTNTHRVFTEDEFREIVDALPSP
ncbi:MAG: GYD domain-containing protein [Pseudomonadota bacterium]